MKNIKYLSIFLSVVILLSVVSYCFLYVALQVNGRVASVNSSTTTPLGLIRTERIVSDDRRNPTLFDRYGLTNLKILEPLAAPRKLFEFGLEPNRIHINCSDERKPDRLAWSMIAAIKSDFRRAKERHAIRESWGAIQFLNSVRIEVLFIIATPESQEVQKLLEIENGKFGDLLQVRMNETYRSIGLKALASMQWISDRFPETWMYFSGDDDILPNLQRLISDINALIAKISDSSDFVKSLPIHCGLHYAPVPPVHRGGKWVVTKEEFPDPSYPPICLGGFYGMTVKLAKSIYNASRYYPYFRLDDVFITSFMRLKVCDTFKKGEYNFDTSDNKCAISPVQSTGFKHIHIGPTPYINLWKLIEESMLLDGLKIIKRVKDSED